MKRRSFFRYSALFLASSSVISCNTRETTRSSANPDNWPDTLSFAVTDADGVEELNRDYQEFRSILAEILDCEIEFFPVESTVAAAPAMLTGNLDFAWAGPLEYLILQARAEAIPVVSLQRPHFRTSIAVRKKDGMTSVADLKGKTIEISEVGSTGSHIGTAKLLLDAGLDPKTDVTFTASGGNTMAGLVSGEVDALGRPEHRYYDLLKKENLSEEDYPVIALGEAIPGDIFMVNSQFEPSVVEEMRSRILANSEKLLDALWSVEELKIRFEDASFTPVQQAEYDEIRDIYNDYSIIAESSRLPGDIFVASQQLEQAVIETMRSRMLENSDRLIAGIQETPSLAKKFKNSSLTPVNLEEYEKIREVYQALGQENLLE